MELWRDPSAFRRACDEARARGERVGLVPTMGALHAGHLSLVAETRRRASWVAVTVFVNPTQFGPGEDFERYPRNLEADAAFCEREGASGIFAPATESMYPPGEETRVRVGATAGPLCGAHRPGHFEGVATVVTKLLVLTGPCVAAFGRKDYQQLKVIERLVADLFLPTEVVGVRTLREPDGLAMSSRNAYLSAEQRTTARAIPRALTDVVQAFRHGERQADALAGLLRRGVEQAATSIDYGEVVDADTLKPYGAGERIGERALAAVAIRIGPARLIDNVVLGEDPAPLEATSNSSVGT